jgi:hypothetical protein
LLPPSADGRAQLGVAVFEEAFGGVLVVGGDGFDLGFLHAYRMPGGIGHAK